MRKLIFFILWTVSFVGGYASSQKVFEIKRGINLSHWLSQRIPNGPSIQEGMNETDFNRIVRAGFDHVRLPIDEEVLWHENGGKDKEAFSYLHKGIQWALQNDLKVIVDLHIVRSHYFNAGHDGKKNLLWESAEAQDHFLQLWQELVQELKEYPTSEVAYEIMNEPTAPNHEDWNKLVEKAYQVIRKEEKERVLVIGSNMWQGVYTFPFLKVPKGDGNILLSCHFYEPFLLSHYRASWTEFGNYQGPVYYPGELVTKQEFEALSEADQKLTKRFRGMVWDKAMLAAYLSKAKQVADEKGLNLYCGEFGVYEKAPKADALRWFKDVISVFDSLHIAWSIWDYKDSFGAFTPQGLPKKDLMHTLMSGSSKRWW